MDESPYWNYKDWARHIVDFIIPLLIYLTLESSAEVHMHSTPKRCQANLPFPCTIGALGLRNTSTLPSITSTSPASAGAVH